MDAQQLLKHAPLPPDQADAAPIAQVPASACDLYSHLTNRITFGTRNRWTKDVHFWTYVQQLVLHDVNAWYEYLISKRDVQF